MMCDGCKLVTEGDYKQRGVESPLANRIRDIKDRVYDIRISEVLEVLQL